MFFASNGIVRSALAVMAVIAGLILTGCDNSSGKGEFTQLKIVSGDNQCALPNEKFTKKLMIHLSGEAPNAITSGKSNVPLADYPVKFAVEPGSDLIITPAQAVSDVAGNISVEVTAGKKIGDQYLLMIPERNPEKTARARFVCGVKISGNEQEGQAGTTLAEPLEVKLVDSNNQPRKGVEVYFNVRGDQKDNLKFKKNMVKTNSDGIAATPVSLGSKTGAYKFDIEIADDKQDIHIRGIDIKVMGINIYGVIISVLGGLALFVYGMHAMSDGLQKVAGNRMRTILHFFARNGIVAVLAGAGVTAVIQSSSATTVMVIGFINAGLLNLTQAIGIIFGANIGTTITAQIISFNLSGIAMPAIIIGLCTMFMKNNIVKGWGETVFGFGLLFFGMNIMGGELKVLGVFPSFIEFFKSFNCSPVDGFMPLSAVLGAIMIGTVMTVIIQSSSAAMGIVLALAASGLIDFYTSIPLLLGTNIGTTITAFLAALAANRHAKQAALAHFLFNFIGSILMVAGFYIPFSGTNIPIFLYLVNVSTPGDAFAAEPQNLERHIAMAHTYFNVINVLILLPFIGLIAKLCEGIIPTRKETPERISRLEPLLIHTPSIALEQSISALREMTDKAWSNVDRAFNQHFMLENTNQSEIEEVRQAENVVDKMQSEITGYLVKITREQLTEPQSQLIPLLMHCTNDAERIGDHAENIIELTERLSNMERKISDEGKSELTKMWEILDDQAHNVMNALAGSDHDLIDFALKDEKLINHYANKYEANHIARLRSGNCSVSGGIIFIELLNELEKIGDHLSNIAERTGEIQKHYIELHSGKRNIK